MVTKAKIIRKVSTESNKYVITIPIFNQSQEIEYEATLATNPGTYEAYESGDVVFVSFDTNDESKPIILGKLYLGNQDKAEGSSNITGLKVTRSAVLPRNTQIGEVTGEQLEKLFRATAHLEDLIEQLQPSAYKSLTKIDNKPLLYKIVYDDIDDVFATDNINRFKESSFGCSSIRKGNFHGRNFDWEYDSRVCFEIYVNRKEDENGNIIRYKSMGVAYDNNLIDTIVSIDKRNEAYKILPFETKDGFNENGVVININVVDVHDNGVTPDKEKAEPIPSDIVGTRGPIVNSRMLPRYILDRAKSAEHAIQLLRNIRLQMDESLAKDSGFEAHYMISDAVNTYIAEVYKNELCITECGTDRKEDKTIPAMCNFYRTPVVFNTGGSLYCPADNLGGESPIFPHDINKLGYHSAGVERYNLINERYDSLNTEDDMKTLLSGKIDEEGKPIGLAYTNAYTCDMTVNNDKAWFSEFTVYLNIPDKQYERLLTINTPKLIYAQNAVDPKGYVNICRELYKNRHRPDTTWQTTHSVVYSINEQKMSLHIQEGLEGYDKWYDFYLNDPEEKQDSFIGMISESDGSAHLDNEERVKLLYGYDTEWEKIEGRVIQGSNESHKAGDIVEAGLPNIIGRFTTCDVGGREYPEGAFYQNIDYGSTIQAGSGTEDLDVGFDASRSNSIYGNSTTVQPPAYIVNIWRRIK